MQIGILVYQFSAENKLGLLQLHVYMAQ